MKDDFKGVWRIIEMDGWPTTSLHAEGQAKLLLEDDQLGSIRFGYLEGQLDYRLTNRGGKPTLEFTWEGEDNGDLKTGRACLSLDEDGVLRGRFFIHMGDESSLIASRS